MSVDYRNQKTPFYEIHVSGPNGGNASPREVKLPHHILRLVDSVDINETYQSGEYTTIKIRFIEGSREPASPDSSVGTKGLYQITSDTSLPIGQVGDNNSISGSITNRPGAITDLRFSGDAGITFLTPQEQIEGAIDNSIQENVEGDLTTRSHRNENKAPQLLFQERNRIRVKWGYKENESEAREITCLISMVSVNYTADNQITTEIIAYDLGKFADQLAPLRSFRFSDEQDANGTTIFTDQTTEKILRRIAGQFNEERSTSGQSTIQLIASSNLTNNLRDKAHVKVILAGESVHQFLTRLAKESNAYYKFIPDPKNKSKDLLIFIKKNDFYSRTINIDNRLVTYKGPNSLIKSVGIKADFGTIHGDLKRGYDEDGGNVDGYSKHGEDETVTGVSLFNNTPEQHVDLDPKSSGNRILTLDALNELLGNDYCGYYEDTPSLSTASTEDSAKVTAADLIRRTITLELAAIGDTKFRPGLLRLNNLGVRYSGTYELLSVNHKIDSNGYAVTAKGLGYTVNGGGVNVTEALKAQNTESDTSRVQLFEKSPDQVGRNVSGNRNSSDVVFNFLKSIGYE